MTAPEAAPIPADVLALARLASIEIGEWVVDRSRKHPRDIVADLLIVDRASQEERTREDERGLRGKIVYPCARFRNDGKFRDPNGYVIIKAERAEASEGRPSPMYYTLVSDTGDVRTLLSTLFTRNPDRARLRGDAS